MSIERKEIAAIREDYSKSHLSKADVLSNPLEQFSKWFQEALTSEVTEPTAMVLSTVSEKGFPSSRVVLLKDIRKNGLSFFTNYTSKKAKEIIHNPSVSILFFWPELQRQIRIEGQVEKLPAADSDEYFASRPRNSQIGAIASPQSQEIKDREVLENQVNILSEKFKEGQNIPRPNFWGGFLVKPVRYEFWQGRSSRLHDRIIYEMENNNWIIKRIAP
ncbi:MAG: pyridoxamine 5'-phosphate oxidase [Sphingobacterium sp.]